MKKVKKRTVVCPVCDGPAKRRWDKSEEPYIAIHCQNGLCQYRYICQMGSSAEVFAGVLCVQFEFDSPHDPGCPQIIEQLERLRTTRMTVLAEARSLYRNPEAILMFECIAAANANREALAFRFYDWLCSHRVSFPLIHQAITVRKEIDDRKHEGRLPDPQDHDGYDSESSGFGCDGGPVG